MIHRLLIVLGFAFLTVGVLATTDLAQQRPRLPVQLGGPQGLTVLGDHPGRPNAAHGLRSGDRIREVEQAEVGTPFYLAFFLDGLRVGDTVSLVVERRGQLVRTRALLVRSLGTGLLVINFAVALLVWAFGMLVLLKSAIRRESNLFYWMTMALAVVMFVYWPENSLGFKGGRWLSLVLSNGLYPLTVAFLLHFALVYPEGWWRRWMRWFTPAIYLPALAVAVALILLLPPARASLDPAAVADWQFGLQQLLPIQLAVFLIAGLIALAVSYLRALQPTSRHRLKWLFWGFGIGISPHVLLHELPKAFGLDPLLPESLSYLLASFAPTAFFISVVRHQMLDINVVIRRSLVYSLLTLFVVGVYLMLVGLGDWLAMRWWGHTVTWMRVVVVMLLAVAFEPARRLAQRLVDRVFYRTQYDQRTALMEYSRELAHALDIDRLADRLRRLLDRVLPLESLRVFTAHEGQVVEVAGDEPRRRRGPTRLSLEQLGCLSEAADSGAFAPSDMPAELDGTALLAPLRIDQRLIGLLALGSKRSGEEMTAEDRGLIKALADQTAVAFDRARAFKVIQDMNVNLEQKVWQRTQQLAEANDRLAAQYEQLRKLNEMKEALTRMVVHDLKNPVSTILLGLEVLDRSELGELPPNVGNTLDIISSTAQEIQDLIANLLDIYRMECGELQLARDELPLRDLCTQAEQRVTVLARYRRVELALQIDDGLRATVDRDLMRRVLINLLVNAVKHSQRAGRVELEAGPDDGTPGGVEVSVTNGGPVIPAELQPRVFEKFFQVEGKRSGVIAGSGLGLAFCKLVVEAHGGAIAVQSPAPGLADGARFSIRLPGLAADQPGACPQSPPTDGPPVLPGGG